MLKFTLFVAALSLSFSAHAKKLTSDIESMMVEAIIGTCDFPQEAQFKLEQSSIKEIVVDQGIRDYVYTAVFAVSYLGKDEQTLVHKQAKVQLKEYQVSNPAFNPYELLTVTSSDGRTCK